MKRLSKLRTLLLLPVLVAVGLVIWLAFFHKSSPKPAPQQSNYNSISDSSTGISFNMSKRFAAIPREQLAALNPGFSYGFRSNDDPNALCIVSNVKLQAGGTISPTELRDGIMNEIKKIHPDAVVANEATALNPAKFGNAQGVLLEIDYTDGTLKVRRAEAIGLGKANEVIAYCQSLMSDNAKYYNDFTTFFSSLKLTQ